MNEPGTSTTETIPILTMDDPHARVWEKLDALSRSTLLRKRFPLFADAFVSLHEVIRTVFGYNLDAENLSKADLCIYGLGRLCLEDFTEIVFLVEHDYGYAALKLLRGLYERAVTGEIILENPDKEARRFIDFFAIAQRKFSNRAKEVLKEVWANNSSVKAAEANMGDSYERLADSYKYEPCKECGRQAFTAWTDRDLNSLARSLGNVSKDPELKALGKGLGEQYLFYATIPNDYIHASVVPIFRRLSRGPNESGFDPSPFALKYAHTLILLALDTQNRYFELGLDSTLDCRHKDRNIAWPVPVAGPKGEFDDQISTT